MSSYTATLGFASWILWHKRSRLALPVGGLALGLIGLIGPSRVYTGDHRWSDVAGGYAMGLTYLAILIALAKRDHRLGPHAGASVRLPPRAAAAGGEEGSHRLRG